MSPPKYGLVNKDVATWIGEGPHWSQEEECLYFVDILGYKIGRLDPKTGKAEMAKVIENRSQ